MNVRYTVHFKTVVTALTACGIETLYALVLMSERFAVVTALTACGIETDVLCRIGLPADKCCNSTYRLRY